MTATLDLTSLDDAKVHHDYTSYGDHYLEIVLNGDATVKVTTRWNYCDVEELHSTFRSIAEELRKLLKDWEDDPDFHGDGWVGEDDRSHLFNVYLEGREWKSGLPDKDIAIIELARAMVHHGCFPNAWFEGPGSYGTFAIDDQVRRYHDEGGTNMVELPGVEYRPGQLIVVADYGVVEVEEDYGDAGIVFHTYDGLEFTDDRDEVRRETALAVLAGGLDD